MVVTTLVWRMLQVCLGAVFNCSLATRIGMTESPMGKAFIRPYGENAVESNHASRPQMASLLISEC